MRNLRLHRLATCVRRPVVSKVRSADFLRSATSLQVIREYCSVIVTLKFTYFVNQSNCVFFNDRGTSLIGDFFFV
jgi:hypothetical protein